MITFQPCSSENTSFYKEQGLRERLAPCWDPSLGLDPNTAAGTRTKLPGHVVCLDPPGQYQRSAVEVLFTATRSSGRQSGRYGRGGNTRGLGKVCLILHSRFTSVVSLFLMSVLQCRTSGPLCVLKEYGHEDRVFYLIQQSIYVFFFSYYVFIPCSAQ